MTRLPAERGVQKACNDRDGSACAVARAARCDVPEHPKAHDRDHAMPTSDSWLSHSVCSTTATRNAPTNREVRAARVRGGGGVERGRR